MTRSLKALGTMHSPRRPPLDHNDPCAGQRPRGQGLLRVGCIVVWLACSAAPAGAGDFPRPGEWPCFRGNPALDGHATGSGKLTEPGILWTHRFSSAVAWGRVRPAGAPGWREIEGIESLALSERCAALGLPTPPEGDIGGVRRTIEHSATTTFADILPDVPGLEKVHFPSSFQLPTKDGQWQYGPGQLLAWRDGDWHLEWEVKDVGRTFSASPLVGDFDADGEPEIAVLPWYDLRVYDARTGRREQRCEMTSGRSYGFFGAYDFDGDGVSEFLVLADFSKHFEVLGYRDGRLQLLWQDEIELDIADPQTIVRILPEPVADVDGDGHSEIVVAVFNRTGDGRWHTQVRDALTGEVRVDLVDELVQGIVDLDGDGRSELLSAVTNGQHVPVQGTIRVRQWDEGTTSVVWQRDESAWHSHETITTLHNHFAAATGAMARRLEGRDIVVVRHSSGTNGRQAISRAEWSDGTLKLGPTLIAQHARAVGLDDQGQTIAEVECSPEGVPIVHVEGGTFDLLVTQSPSQHLLTPPIVVRPAEADRPLVVVQDTSSSLSWVAIEPPADQASPRESLRLAQGSRISNVASTSSDEGKSPTDESASHDASDGRLEISELHVSRHGPVAADLAGDGRRQLLVAMASREGAAQLVALDVESAEAAWCREFDRFSAGRFRWNNGGPLIWQTAHLTDSRRQDVLFTLRRSRMHSEETYALSGRNGHTLWHRDRQIADRSFGGQPFAMADYDADGLDDLASFYTHIHYLADGATGEDLLAEVNDWAEVPVSPVYWGQPVAGRFGPEPNETSLLFTTGGRQMIGLVRLDGRLAWSDAYDKAANGFPAIGDFDGDGQPEAIFIGFEDGIRCYQLSTGSLRWSLPLAAGQDVKSAVSGDLDGDGRDEAVFALGQTVYCLGTDATTNEGRVEWQLDLPTVVSSPVIADVQSPADQAGQRLSVLVCGQDGVLYCIGQRD